MDNPELFPGVNLGSAPANGACRSPVGRRHGRRPSPARHRYRPPSATQVMLAGIRALVGNGLADIRISLRRIENDVARNADALADLSETIDHPARPAHRPRTPCRQPPAARDAATLAQETLDMKGYFTRAG